MNNLIPDWPIQATTMEGDAIVNLARMFQDNDRAVQLFLLTETPGLRYQLHHNHLMDVAWWSVFDAIQGITLKSGLPLTLNDLTWPKGAPIRFVYGIYRTIVFQGDKQIASVYFHRDGFVWRVVWSDVAGKCVDQYDDRGFLSRRQWQDQDNQPFKTVWFDERGNVVLTQTDQIQVAGAVASRFRQATYPQLADVVIEYAAAYLEEQDVTALVAPYTTALRPLVDRLAVHYPTYGIVTESDLGQDMVLSPKLAGVATTTERTEKRVTAIAPVQINLHTISPYPTQLNLGHSTELTAIQIYWVVNHISLTRQQGIYDQLLKYLAKDEHRMLVINCDSKEQTQQFSDKWLHFIAQQLHIPEDSAGFTQLRSFSTKAPQWVGTLDKAQIAAIQQWLSRLIVRVNSGFAEIQADLSTARVVVDLGDVPHLFTQIAAISAGVPQINRVATGLVDPHENGIILDNDNKLIKALRYYMDTLTHWNESLVNNVQRIEDNAEESLLAAWGELLKDE